MPKFGRRSLSQLNSCHPKLIELFREVVKGFDCSVLKGHRNKEEQDECFRIGSSEKEWPNSEHNRLPSKGVDVAPYYKEKPHIRWKDRERFYFFAGYVKGIAASMGIKIRFGCDWDGDTEVHDQTLFDLPHYEIVED